MSFDAGARPQRVTRRPRQHLRAATVIEPGVCPAPGRPVAGKRGVDMRRVIRALRERGDEGMTVAEYTVGTVAACGFGGVLYKILTSTPVIHLVTEVISHALHLGL
jgi:hypothetical protein